MTTNSVREALVGAVIKSATTPPALQNTLKEWAKDDNVRLQMESKKAPAPTLGVTQATFNYVRDNPGQESGEIRRVLQARGYNIVSVASLMSQLVLQRQLALEDGKYRAIVPKYMPLMSGKKMTALRKQRARANAKLAKTAPQVLSSTREKKASIPMPAPVPTPVRQITAQSVLDNMPIGEAKALYMQLKAIFEGGAK